MNGGSMISVSNDTSFGVKDSMCQPGVPGHAQLSATRTAVPDASRIASASRVSRLSLSVALLAGMAIPLLGAAAEEGHHGKSADEIAKELANPNSSLASLTFKNQYRWYKGDLPEADDQENYTLLFQPVFPFPLEDTASGGKANLFVRPAIPLVVDQPVYSADGWDEVSAMGDWGFDLAYGVTEKNGFIWALGMVGTLPTATKSEVAGKQWRLGPEFFIGKASEKGLIGIFPNHQWDVSGWGEGKDYSYSTTQIQPFLKYLPGGGWAVGSLPIMTYDWEGEEWTIPLNLTVSKTVSLGDTPLKVELDLNYYVEQPDAFGPDWMVGINITPVVPNFINNWIRGN